jgi:hypothetical protein
MEAAEWKRWCLIRVGWQRDSGIRCGWFVPNVALRIRARRGSPLCTGVCSQGLEGSRFDAEAAGRNSTEFQLKNLHRHFRRGCKEIDDVRGRPDAAKYPAERQQSCFVQLHAHLRTRILGDDHAKAAVGSLAGHKPCGLTTAPCFSRRSPLRRAPGGCRSPACAVPRQRPASHRFRPPPQPRDYDDC